jgi:hypothetical protein
MWNKMKLTCVFQWKANATGVEGDGNSLEVKYRRKPDHNPHLQFFHKVSRRVNHDTA